MFLDYLFRKMHFDQQTVKSLTVPEYLDRYPNLQVAQPVMSSWGHKGYCEVWCEGSNDWIYPHLHEGADRMVELARTFPDVPPLKRRALNQAARELLLVQSSDWAFIMKTGTMVSNVWSPKRAAIRPVKNSWMSTVLPCTIQSMRAKMRVCSTRSG